MHKLSKLKGLPDEALDPQLGERASDGFLATGKESPALEPVDVPLLIEEMLQLLKVSISKHAILTIDSGKDIPVVQTNPAQIRQAVMNLVANAAEAIGERAGVIRIHTSLVRKVQDLLGSDNRGRRR